MSNYWTAEQLVLPSQTCYGSISLATSFTIAHAKLWMDLIKVVEVYYVFVQVLGAEIKYLTGTSQLVHITTKLAPY